MNDNEKILNVMLLTWSLDDHDHDLITQEIGSQSDFCYSYVKRRIVNL